MSKKLTQRRAVSILTLTGLWGSSQVAFAQDLAYVANFASNNVSVIDTSSNTVVATVMVGNQPNSVAITPDGTRAFVTNGGGDVWVINTSSNTVAAKVVVGGYPSGVAITPDGTRAYVTKTNANAVSAIDISSNKVIDTSSNTVVATVNLGLVGPIEVAIAPDGTRAYVLESMGNLTVINTSSNTVAATILLSGNQISPFGLALSPDGTRAYVTRFAANTLAVIDTSSGNVIATPAVGGFPNGVAVTPDGKRAYVTTSIDATGNGNGNVAVIDTASNIMIASVGVGSTPYGLVIQRVPAAPFVCSNTTPPVISSVDSASAYGGYSYFASGSWLEIKGSNLADSNDPRLQNATHSTQWETGDFNGPNAPTSIDGIGVHINGKPAFLSYLSPTQLNVQAPEDSTSGPAAITVTNCNATSEPVMFTRQPLAPGLLAPPNYSANGTRYMVATFNSDGAYVLNTTVGAGFGLNSRPAKPGDLIIAYGIGFGDVTPSILPGVVESQANRLASPVSFSFGTANATLSYFGLAPTFVGLYEFYITVPAGLADGDYQVKVTQNGASLPQTLYLTVHN